MKWPKIVLAVSLASNAAVLWLLTQRAAETERPSILSDGARPAKESAAASTAGKLTLSKAATALTDYAEHRDWLLAAGFPADVVRAAIRASIEEPRLARQREFYAMAAKQPWWQGGVVTQNITPEQQEELRRLEKADRAEVLRVLGPSAFVTDAERERYSFLTPDKAERLAILERDYVDLAHERVGSGLAGDGAEQQQLLKSERERDLAELLTPEERGLLFERVSNTARSIASRLEFFPATDAEYRTLFALQRNYDEQNTGSIAAASLEARQARAAAMTKLQADIQQTLGPERYAAYLLSQRSEYRGLVELQRRFEVSPIAVEQVARLQGETMAAGNRVIDDASLTGEQKKAALTDLAGRARAGVTAALGPELGNTLLKATGAGWVDLLERAGAYSMQSNGAAMTRYVVNERPTPPVASPPSAAKP